MYDDEVSEVWFKVTFKKPKSTIFKLNCFGINFKTINLCTKINIKKPKIDIKAPCIKTVINVQQRFQSGDWIWYMIISQNFIIR